MLSRAGLWGRTHGQAWEGQRMHEITRRATLGLGAAAAIAGPGALAQPAAAPGTLAIPRADIPAPNLPIEPGATLRVMRPARFVEPDEVIFR
jgi:multiple sugar transport system substrate-binding protein